MKVEMFMCRKTGGKKFACKNKGNSPYEFIIEKLMCKYIYLREKMVFFMFLYCCHSCRIQYLCLFAIQFI